MAKRPQYRPEQHMNFDAGMEGAKKMARALEAGGVPDAEVEVNWNEVILVVKKDSDTQKLWREFCAENDRRNELAKPAMLASLKAAQLAIYDSLGRMEDEVTKGNAASALAWLLEYGERSNYVGVDAQKKKVLDTLSAAGYVANEFQRDNMGMKETMNALGDQTKARRYMIGQMMFQMEHDQPLGQVSEVLALEFERAALPPEAEPPETGKPTRLMRQITYKTT